MAKKSKATRASDSSNGSLQKTEHIMGFEEPKLELDAICIRKMEVFFLSLNVVLLLPTFMYPDGTYAKSTHRLLDNAAWQRSILEV
jgi:hypothetical protein